MKTNLQFLLVCLYSAALWAQQPASCDTDFPRTEIQVQLVDVGTLSEARIGIAAASKDNKIFFAGGINNSGNSSRVDIYDITTQSWTTAELSVARHLIASVSNGNKVFFAGGEVGDGTWPVDNVDIFDTTTNTWTTDHLSTPGSGLAATVVGNKVLFAGGDNGFTGNYRGSWVDIYDLSSGTWTTSRLSGGEFVYHRDGLSAVSWGNKAYLAGGGIYKFENGQGTLFTSDYIDIYDHTSNTWSVSTLYEAKGYLGAVALNDKIYWAGGSNGSYPNTYLTATIEIYDTNTGNSTFECLKEASIHCWAVLKNNIIFFFSNTSWGATTMNIDIYDPILNIWYHAVIPYLESVISVNNTIYGVQASKLYELDFGTALSIPKLEQEKVSVYPNPVMDILTVSSGRPIQGVTLYDLSGRQVKSQSTAEHFNEIKLDLGTLPSGIFFVKVNSENVFKTFKVIKN